MKFKIGDKVKITEDNDNDNYIDYRNKTLVVTSTTTSGIAYDSGLYPQGLYELETIDKIEVPFMLYDYELEYA